MPPEPGGICGRLTYDLPLGYLQGGNLKHGTTAWERRQDDRFFDRMDQVESPSRTPGACRVRNKCLSL